MTRKVSNADFDNAIRDYLAGESIEVVARRYHTSDWRLSSFLKSRDLLRTKSDRYAIIGRKNAAISTKYDALTGEIVHRYAGGESELSIATALHISRNVVERRVKCANVRRRTIAEANTIRFRDPHQCGIATRKAHLSMGRGETEVCRMLVDRGYTPQRQVVVGRYNIDIVIPAVAVEVHWRSDHPFRRAFDRQRIKYLTELGWHIIYIWIDANHPLTDDAANYIIAFAQVAQRNPAGIGQYRVVRGSGEIVTEGCGDVK